jgi:glycerophosphoryl diester phosphodiesterase
VALDARALWSGAASTPLLSSFSEEALAAAQVAAPELPRAMLFEKVPADWPNCLARLQCVALDTDFREIDRDLVGAVHRGGYKLLCYTPNDPAQAAELARWGVDGIITDAIGAIRPA